jgi:hypothetical protein
MLVLAKCDQNTKEQGGEDAQSQPSRSDCQKELKHRADLREAAARPAFKILMFSLERLSVISPFKTAQLQICL